MGALPCSALLQWECATGQRAEAVCPPGRTGGYERDEAQYAPLGVGAAGALALQYKAKPVPPGGAPVWRVA